MRNGALQNLCWANAGVQGVLSLDGLTAALSQPPQPDTPAELEAIYLGL